MSSSSQLMVFHQHGPTPQTSRENAMASMGPYTGCVMGLGASYLCHFGLRISAGGSRELCSKDRDWRGNVRRA